MKLRGNVIKGILANLDRTIDWLYQEAEISKAQIYKILSGESGTSPQKMTRLAKALDVNPDYLIAGKQWHGRDVPDEEVLQWINAGLLGPPEPTSNSETPTNSAPPAQTPTEVVLPEPVMADSAAKPLHTSIAAKLAAEQLAVRDASAPPPPRYDLLPHPPPHFVHRNEQLVAIKNALLANPSGEEFRTSLRVGISGMGGIGKSVLAAEAGRDQEIQNRFSRIVRVELGVVSPGDRRIEQCHSLIADFVMGESRVFENPQQGKAYLQKHLADLSILLIVDDIWQLEDIESFDVLGTTGALLFTTRDSGIVRRLGSVVVEVSLLEDAQARTLLAHWAGIEVLALPPEARQILKRCGNLPLAVAMIGGVIQSTPGQSKNLRWQDALESLDNADLEALEKCFPGYPHPNLLAALQISVDALPQNLKRCFLDFAVFVPDAHIPESVFHRYWETTGLSPAQIRRALHRLQQRALVMKQGDEPRFHLHDLITTYLRKLCGPSIPEMHRRMIEDYRKEAGQGYHALPPDGYLHANLAIHLSRSGNVAELSKLLLDFKWLMAKLEHTDVFSLIADFELLPSDRVLSRVRNAIQLSTHVIVRRENFHQLPARLLSFLSGQDDPRIAELIRRAGEYRKTPWLLPVRPSSDLSGVALRRIFGELRKACMRCCAFTPDGMFAVCVYEDRCWLLWDLDLGHKRFVEPWDTAADHIEVSANGGYFLASGRFSDVVPVWSMESGKIIARLAHGSPVTAIAISHDGLRAYAATERGELWGWLVNGASALHEPAATHDQIASMKLAPDESLLYLSSGKVWTLENGKIKRELPGQGDRRDALKAGLRLSLNGNYLVVAGFSFLGMEVVETTGNRRHWEIPWENGETRQLALHPDGNRLIATFAHLGRTLYIFDFRSGKLVSSFSGHSGTIIAIGTNPRTGEIISASRDRTIRVWDADVEAFESDHAFLNVWAVAGDHAITRRAGNRLAEVWSLSTGRHTSIVGSERGAEVRFAAVTPDGSVAILIRASDAVEVRSVSSGKVMQEFNLFSLARRAGSEFAVEGRPVAFNISRSADILVSIHENGYVNVWNPLTVECVRTIKLPWPVAEAMMDVSGRKIIIPGPASTMFSIDLTGDEPAKDMGTLPATFSPYVFHGGLNLLLLVSNAGGLCLRRAVDSAASTDETKERITKSPQDHVDWADISPDGRCFVTTNFLGGDLVVWDIKSFSPLASYTTATPFRHCFFAPDSRTIIVGDSLGRLCSLKLVLPTDPAT